MLHDALTNSGGSARAGGRSQPDARDNVDAVVGGAAAGGGAAGVRITRAWTVARVGRGECCTGGGHRAAGTAAARSAGAGGGAARGLRGVAGLGDRGGLAGGCVAPTYGSVSKIGRAHV